MADKKQKIILSFVVDKTSLKKAQSAIAGLNKSFVVLDKSATQSSMASVDGVEAVAKAAKDSKSSVAELGDELSGRVTASGEELKRIMKELGTVTQKAGKDGKKAFSDLDKAAANALDEFEKIVAEVNDLEGDAPQAIKKMTKEVSRLNDELQQTGKQIGSVPKSFDEASKQFGSFGDIESAGRTFGGGFAKIPGLEGVDVFLAGLAEIPAGIEAAGRIGPAFREAGSSMRGLSGGALKMGANVGIAVVAFAAIGTAVSVVNEGLNKQKEISKATLGAIRDAEETIAGGDIGPIVEAAELAQKNIDLAREQNAIDKERLARSKAAADAGDPFSEFLFDVKDIFETTPLDDARKAAKESGLAALEAAEANDTYTKFLESAEGQLLLAAKAQEELNQQVIANAKSESEIVRFKLNQQDKSSAQLEDENRAREKSLTVIEAQIKAIVDSGEVNEQTAEEMVKLQEAGRGLLSEMRFVADTAIPAAKALEELAKAEEDQTIAAEEAAKATEEAAEESAAAAEKIVDDETSLGRQRTDVVIQTLENIAAAEKKHADELVKLSEQAASAEQKVLDDLTNRLVKLREDGGRRESDAVRKEQQRGLEEQIKAQRQVVDDSLAHVRALQDIQQKAADDEIGLRQSRDFRGVVNARRAARIQIQGAQKDFTRQQKDRVADQLRAKDDRARAFAQERNDRLLKYQQDINDARNQARQQRIDAVNAGRQAILDARAKQIQELSDIRDSGIQALTMRRQLAAAELQLIGQMTGTAAQLFSQLSSQLSGFTGNNNQTVNNTSNSTTTATTNNNIGAINVGSGGHSIMRALVR